MLDIVFKNIRRRKVRSAITAIGVACVIFLVMMSVSIATLIETDMERMVAGFAGQMYVKSPAAGLAYEEFPPVSSSIEVEVANEILKVEGIDTERSSPILFTTLMPSPYPGAPPVLAVGILPGKEKAFIGDVKAARGVSTFSEEARAEAIVGSFAGWWFDVDIGDNLTIAGQPLRVIGVLEESVNVVNFATLVPLSYAQEIMHRKDSVSAVLLTAERVGRVGEIANAIKGQFPDLEVVTQEEAAKNTEVWLSGMRQWFDLLDYGTLGAGIAIVAVVMVMAVTERTREIGTLRAIGAKKRTILLLVLQESIILSLLGCLVGVAITIMILGSPDWWGSAANYIKWLAEYPGVLFQALTVAMLIGALAGLYPAYRAAKLSPMEALRYE